MKRKMFSLIMLQFVLLTLSLNAQCLSGVYTIGGVSPTYTSVAQAVSALTANGVCGAVTFNIRPGTYIEQVTIPAITGSSAANNITFQSETGDSSSVTIQYAGAINSDYIIKLDGATYVTFSKLHFQNTTLAYPCNFGLQNSSNDIIVTNCWLESPIISGNTGASALISVSNSGNTDLSFMNSYFYGGRGGVEILSTASLPVGVTVSGNNFQEQAAYAVTVSNGNNVLISGNRVNCTLNSNTYEGFNFWNCTDNIVVEKNIISSNSGLGMHLNGCAPTGSLRTRIINNVIYHNPSTLVFAGIKAEYSPSVDYFHNTIIAYGTVASPVYCIQTYGNSNLDVRNNIFWQQGDGYIYNILSVSNSTFDYNNIYSSGSSFILVTPVHYPTMAAWNALGYDLNSLNYLPQFVSASDFHIASDFSQSLMLPYLSSVPDDLEGTARDNTSPYFGAYEFANTLNADDASVKKFITPVSNSCGGTLPVSVLLKNYGTAPLTSVTINWQAGGVNQTPFTWSGNLAYYDTVSVTIGSVNFTVNNVYQLKAWTSQPNGNSDPFDMNDTAVSPNVMVNLNGTYTIGGTAPDFATIGAAVSTVTAAGVCGPVVFDIRPGTYNEQISIGQIAGVSAVNTVTFQAENADSTSVIIETAGTSTSNYVVELNGPDYLRFRSLTFSNTNTIYADIIKMTNDVQFFELHNSVLLDTGVAGRLIYLSGYNYLIKNSVFVNGGKGIDYTANSSVVSDFLISGNTFTDQKTYGVYLNSINSPKVMHNTFSSSVGSNSYSGIYLGLCKDSVYVCKNYIDLVTGYAGILLYNCFGTPPLRINVNNNRVSITSPNNYAGGLHIEYTTNVDVFHNTSVANGSAYSWAMYNYNNNNEQIKNNILYSTGQGYAMSVMNSNLVQSNFNDLYTNASSTVYDGGPLSFAAWQAMGFDTNSVSVQPAFVSSNDFHIASDFSQGMILPYFPVVPDDFDGVMRDTASPYFGCYEFPVITTGMQDVFGLSGQQLKLYPNPSGGIYIFEPGEKQNEVVEVFDLTGRFILRVASENLKEQRRIVDLTGLPSGIYIVKAGTCYGRAVKQ